MRTPQRKPIADLAQARPQLARSSAVSMIPNTPQSPARAGEPETEEYATRMQRYIAGGMPPKAAKQLALRNTTRVA